MYSESGICSYLSGNRSSSSEPCFMCTTTLIVLIYSCRSSDVMGVSKAEGCPVSAPEMNPKNLSKCSQGLLVTAEDSSHHQCSCQSA